MQSRLLACLCGLLVLGAAGCGASRQIGHGILTLQAQRAGRIRQIYLWRPGGGAMQIGPESDWINSPTWSPDGTSIAFDDEPGGWDEPGLTDIYVMHADGGDVRRLTHDSARPSVVEAVEPSWSPDGKEIVYVRGAMLSAGARLVVISVGTGHERALPASGTFAAWGKPGIAYTPNGVPGVIKLLNPATGSSRIFIPYAGSIGGFAWSPRGELAVLEGNRVVLYSSSGRRVGGFRLAAPPGEPCGVEWSPDGTRLLITVAHGKDIGVWTTTLSGEQRQRLPFQPSGSCATSWR